MTLPEALDYAAVFWVAAPALIGIAVTAAVLVFSTAHRFESPLRLLTWLDALALAAAVPAGVGVALAAGQPSAIVLIMGIVTGRLGGLLRDVLCSDVPLVLKQGELYVTAALAGAAAAILALGALPLGAGAAPLRRRHLRASCRKPALRLAAAGLPCPPAPPLRRGAASCPPRAARPNAASAHRFPTARSAPSRQGRLRRNRPQTR